MSVGLLLTDRFDGANLERFLEWQETAHNATCGRCAEACEVGINPRHPELGTTFNECTRCHACADVCPGHAISFPLIARKTAGAPALEPTTAGASGTSAIEPELDLDEPSETLS